MSQLVCILVLKYSRINRGEIEAEFQRQVRKLEVAKEDTLKQEDLKAQMENFLQVRCTCDWTSGLM